MYLTNYHRLGFLAILLFFVFNNPAHSQDSKTNLVGVTVLAELVPYNPISPSVGFVFERRFTKRSGLQIGTYYRAVERDYYIDVTYPDGSRVYNSYSVRESYLTFPILYRYYTKALTLSVGPFVEGFVGWDQISTDEVEVTDYEVNPSVTFGPILKVSKPFSIGKNLSIEPELRFGITTRSSEAFYGVGVQLKQQVAKKN